MTGLMIGLRSTKRERNRCFSFFFFSLGEGRREDIDSKTTAADVPSNNKDKKKGRRKKEEKEEKKEQRWRRKRLHKS